MPMISSAHRTLVHYPDSSSKVITLYVRPAEGQIIAHGWEITSVALGGDDGAGVPTDYEISVERPGSDARPRTAAPPPS